MNRKRKRRVEWRHLLVGTALALVLPAELQAQSWLRVVSINLCTDQLLLALNEPGDNFAQIAALSRFSRREDMSYLARQAAVSPSVRGTAEEVLRLAPDVVFAGAFSGRATREFLATRGVRLETFAPPRSIAEAKREIERMAMLLGQSDSGARLVGEIEAAVAEAASRARGRPARSALAIQQRGFVSGHATLLSSAMDAAGLVNAAAALGIEGVGRASLEMIIRLAPDVLIVEGLGSARDQSTALLHHPALARAYPAQRTVQLSAAETTCGGPALAPLIRRLADARLGLQ